MKMRRRTPRSERNSVTIRTSPVTFARTLEQQIEDLMSQVAPRRQTDGDIRRVVSTLFVSIADYVSLCEEAEPPEIGAMLEIYVQTVSDSVGKFLGTAQRSIGDVIMATWNAAYPQADHALLAVNAAIDMIERIDDVQWRLRSSGLPDMSFCVGVNTGDALVKRNGLLRNEGDIIGDSVNVARLLSEIASPGCILIGEGTQVSAGDRILTRETGIELLPGKNRPARSFRVLGRLTTL